jgi:hypothetical protein
MPPKITRSMRSRPTHCRRNLARAARAHASPRSLQQRFCVRGDRSVRHGRGLSTPQCLRGVENAGEWFAAVPQACVCAWRAVRRRSWRPCTTRKRSEHRQGLRSRKPVKVFLIAPCRRHPYATAPGRARVDRAECAVRAVTPGTPASAPGRSLREKRVQWATVELVRVADVVLKAARPLYCALSNDKLASVGIRMPSWQVALARSLGDDLADQAANS